MRRKSDMLFSHLLNIMLILRGTERIMKEEDIAKMV